jgi:hypothetical protein
MNRVSTSSRSILLSGSSAFFKTQLIASYQSADIKKAASTEAA